MLGTVPLFAFEVNLGWGWFRWELDEGMPLVYVLRSTYPSPFPQFDCVRIKLHYILEQPFDYIIRGQ